ncbi:spore coat associated protein CotJA [Psychrobacillus glaciei]|uniref:Spore coat associated protein CotJA n=1 Tax=Psychrobacillus glaciei TaxID=2283160 RepID=A0A5J6SJG7_9BACI|nr:spore coat associated protein CotJA [Psychrobacillus glaciei]QFF97779.1 spore coat associated protein CotJA [Psychrobacillus glaciei]
MDQPLYRGSYKPFVSPLDPCPPILVKHFVLPPQIFTNFQPPGLPQYSPKEALWQGSLWPQFVDGFSREEGIS